MQHLAAGGLEGLGAGIVLCGGGALMRELPTLVTRVFDGIPCALGALPALNFPEIDDDPERIRYATVYGALLRAAKMHQEEIAADSGGGGIRLFNWLGRSGGRP